MSDAKPNATPLEQLAEYLTGGEVGFHSAALSMPQTSSHHRRAQKFFTLRKSLGIGGYADVQEAQASILRALGQS